jgi:ElaB/YqjD/DUF883 family membrane-anchored ribosome-binding protein
MTQPGPSDYRGPNASGDAERAERVVDQTMDQVRETARDVGEAARGAAGDLAATIRQHPYTSMMVAAGLAFALGALWKMGRRRPLSRLEALRAQLPDLSRTEEFLKRWR